MLTEKQYRRLRVLYDQPDHCILTGPREPGAVAKYLVLIDEEGVLKGQMVASLMRFQDKGWLDSDSRGSGHIIHFIGLTPAGISLIEADPRFQLEQSQARIAQLEQKIAELNQGHIS